MQIKQICKHANVMERGAIVLRARATYVQLEGEGYEKFNACYEQAALAYLSWAQNKQGKILKEEYAARKSDRIFGFRPMLCHMEMRVVQQQGRFWSVVVDSIKDSGIRGEYPICHRSADVWDMQRGVIIPMKYFLTHVPELRPLRVGGKRPEGLWLDQGEVVLYHNAVSGEYAEQHTGLHIDFAPKKGNGLQDVVPVLAEMPQNI